MNNTLLKITAILFITSTLFAQGKQAPDFVLPDDQGRNYQLSENLGQGPVLINFWATWCIPCLAEMKKLSKIHSKYEAQGLQILSITIDDTKTVGRVRSVVNTNKFPFTILFDTNRKVFQLYQGENPPHTVLLDKEGNIIYTHTGYRKGDEKKLESLIAGLLEAQKE